jgi:hypothetical protein
MVRTSCVIGDVAVIGNSHRRAGNQWRCIQQSERRGNTRGANAASGRIGAKIDTANITCAGRREAGISQPIGRRAGLKSAVTAVNLLVAALATEATSTALRPLRT